MPCFARATIEHPALFDTAQPVRDRWRRELCKNEFLALSQLAEFNGLSPMEWDELDHKVRMIKDGFTGQTQGELAHMLPDSEAQNPAMYLASRLLGIFRWDGPDDLDSFKSSLRNIFPLTLDRHEKLDKHQTFLFQPTCLPLLIFSLEERLMADEATASGDRWYFDLRRVIRDFSSQLTHVAGLPVAGFRPALIPSQPDDCIDAISYHDSQKWVYDYGSRKRRGIDQQGQPNVFPTTLPVSYKKEEDVPAHLDPHPTGETLPEKLSFVDTFFVNLLTYQALCRRQQLYTTGLYEDLLFERDNGPPVTQEFKDYMRLARYVIDLIFSDNPSSFRSLERPNELLLNIQPPLAAQTLNSTPRTYCYDKDVLSGSSSTASDRPSSPFRRSGFPTEWQELLLAGVKEVDLADVDQAEGQASQPDDMQDQWQRLLERFKGLQYDERLEDVEVTRLNVSRATLQKAEASLMADFEEAAKHASPKALILENWELVPGSWEFGKLFHSLKEQIEMCESEDRRVHSDPRSSLGMGLSITIPAQ